MHFFSSRSAIGQSWQIEEAMQQCSACGESIRTAFPNMKENDLPQRVDVVVIGTGMTESVLASACARSGLKVLHVDSTAYYGGASGAHSLHTLAHWEGDLENSSHCNITSHGRAELEDGETFLPATFNRDIFDAKIEWLESSLDAAKYPVKPRKKQQDDEEAEPEKPQTIRQMFGQQCYKTIFDLNPKVLLASGQMVKTLVDSEVSKYVEFQTVSRLLVAASSTKDESLQLRKVPCSRAEIFESDDLTLKDRRMLMRFINFAASWHNDRDATPGWQEFADRPFEEFLAKQGISGASKDYILHAIAIISPKSNTVKGMEAVCQFVEGMGRYGPSPFLYPVYGSGELPQCFCRLGAVFDATYCLNCKIDGFFMKDGRFTAIIIDGTRITCSHVFIADRHAPPEFGSVSKSVAQRAIYLAEGSICPTDKDMVTMLSLSNLLGEDVDGYLIEAGFSSCIAPKGYYTINVTIRSPEDKTLLEKVEQKILSTGTCKLVHRFSFGLRHGDFTPSENIPPNITVINPSDINLDYDGLVQYAKSIFTSCFPDKDFLPRRLEQTELEEMLPQE